MIFCFILKSKITLFYLLSFALSRCHSLLLFVLPVVSGCTTCCHSLSLFVQLVVSGCTTRCHFSYNPLSVVAPLVATFCTTRCQWLYHSLSFVVIFCTTRRQWLYHSSLFVQPVVSGCTTRCHFLYNPLSVVVPLVLIYNRCKIICKLFLSMKYFYYGYQYLKWRKHRFLPYQYVPKWITMVVENMMALAMMWLAPDWIE